jgi:hypothetical protein
LALLAPPAPLLSRAGARPPSTTRSFPDEPDRVVEPRVRAALAVPPRATFRISPTANRHDKSAEFP